MREGDLRDTVLAALAGLFLKLPEPESVRYALAGLTHWMAQLWNLAATGANVDALIGSGALQNPVGQLPQAGELIHAANAALRVIPGSIMRPVAALLAAPLSPLEGSGGMVPAMALAAAVRQPWSEFISVPRIAGKLTPSK